MSTNSFSFKKIFFALSTTFRLFINFNIIITHHHITQLIILFQVDDRDMPIFITYIWKRSCMAFMMYMNALMMTIVMEFSFSNIYTNNVLAMQLVLYVFRVLSDLAFVGFVKEVQILLPINVVQQVVGVVSTM